MSFMRIWILIYMGECISQDHMHICMFRIAQFGVKVKIYFPNPQVSL